MPSFADLLPAVRRAHDAARSVIPHTGCQLGASLLTLELGQAGMPAAYVEGHYLRPEETDEDKPEHAWVEVEGLVLDPTRDQFGEDPFRDRYQGRYLPRERKPASAMEDQSYWHLGLQWRIPQREQDIRDVARQYGLDVNNVEVYATKTYTMPVVGRSEYAKTDPPHLQPDDGEA